MMIERWLRKGFLEEGGPTVSGKAGTSVKATDDLAEPCQVVDCVSFTKEFVG